MNGYGSEMNARPPFFWEAVGHKHGLMLHRKIMWRDRYSATGCSPALQAVDSKQAENLSVGKTKSYWTNNRYDCASTSFRSGGVMETRQAIDTPIADEVLRDDAHTATQMSFGWKFESLPLEEAMRLARGSQPPANG